MSYRNCAIISIFNLCHAYRELNYAAVHEDPRRGSAYEKHVGDLYLRHDLGKKMNGGRTYIAVDHCVRQRGVFYSALHMPDAGYRPKPWGWCKINKVKQLEE